MSTTPPALTAPEHPWCSWPSDPLTWWPQDPGRRREEQTPLPPPHPSSGPDPPTSAQVSADLSCTRPLSSWKANILPGTRQAGWPFVFDTSTSASVILFESGPGDNGPRAQVMSESNGGGLLAQSTLCSSGAHNLDLGDPSDGGPLSSHPSLDDSSAERLHGPRAAQVGARPVSLRSPELNRPQLCLATSFPRTFGSCSQCKEEVGLSE